MAYGLFLLSRLVAEDRAVWSALSRQMEELLPLTLGIVSEFFEPYDPMPFGLSLDATVQDARSEEHTSELQSQSNLVCRLLLEKKKKTTKRQDHADVCSRSIAPITVADARL